MDKGSTKSPVCMRSQGVLTGQGFSISDNKINLFSTRKQNTCDEIHETYKLIHCSRTIGNFVSLTVNLIQLYLRRRDLG
jgi:hypothetical protein